MVESRHRNIGRRMVASAVSLLAILALMGGSSHLLTTTSAGASVPSHPADPFEGLGTSPFEANGALTADGRRLFDVLAVQGALIRYDARHGAYPGSLDKLVPAFLSTLPRDPGTGRPYSYQATPDHGGYRIEARLSNGRTFDGAPHEGG
jgi:hypothetical protein